MASSKEFLSAVLEKSDGLSIRAMMGDYVLYYNGKVVGGIYDNRLLVKVTKGAEKLLKGEYKIPYPGAKPLLHVKNTNDEEFLKGLFRLLYEELPEPKSKKLKNK